MADGLAITPGTGAIAATDEITTENGVGVSARHAQRVKLDVAGTDGAFTDLSAANPMPVSGAFFPATQPVSIAASVAVTGPLTDTQLRLTPVPISGTVTTGGLTDTQIRATALPVSLASTTVTGSVVVTGPLTDTQLRLTAVPVSLASTTITGTSAISAASLPLPAGAATETTLAALNAKVTAVNTGAVTISAALPTGANAIGSVSSVDTTASGSITAISQNVALALNGKSGAAIQITGTWVGTLQFEGTLNGTDWVAVNGVFAGTSTPGTTITANGLVRLTPSGLAQLRIISTAWTSGTATITMRASDAAGGTFLNQSLTAGTNIIGKVGIDQTTPGTTNLVSIGTNGVVALAAGAAAIGSVSVTGTTAISAVSLPLPAGAATETTLAALNTKVTAVNTGAVTISAALPTGANTIGTTTGPTLTKATQGATGYSVQDLKDAGRVIVNAATAIAGVTCVTAEALLALNISRDGAATASATSHPVTAGKRWRITGMIVSARSTGATVLSARVALRMNPAGAATATSPVIAIASMTQQAAALAEAGDTRVLTFPDGIEISGTMQVGLSQVCSAITGVVYASLIGYEY